jgi:hypothetical protein
MSTRILRVTVGLCCVFGLPGRSPAQRATPIGLVARSAVIRTHEVPSSSGAPTLNDSSSLGSSRLARSATRSRRVQAGYGALLGAALGGTLGFIVAREDRTGEGFTAPVMVAGGATLAAMVGALIGVLLPVHHDPAT